MHRRQTKSFGSARIQTLTHSPWDIAAQSCNNWHCGNTIPETRRRLPSERICKNEALLVHQRKNSREGWTTWPFHSWTNQHRAHPTVAAFGGSPCPCWLVWSTQWPWATRPKNMNHSDLTESPSKDWSLKNDENDDSPLVPFQILYILYNVFKIFQGTVPLNPTFLKERGAICALVLLESVIYISLSDEMDSGVTKVTHLNSPITDLTMICMIWDDTTMIWCKYNDYNNNDMIHYVD